MHADSMGSDRTKIIVIGMFAAVVVAAIAGGFWFFKVHQPATRLADARAEVLAWDARWIEMRNCLLGQTPGSSKVSEALAIREMSPDPWERKSCTQLISQLSRGEAEDTRVPAVEEAWRVLDKAAGKVAISFVSHVDPGGDAMRKKPDPLPVALDELEAAYLALRTAAELGPVKPPTGTKPIPSAQIIPVQLGGKRILSIQEPYIPSRTGMLAFGAVDGAEVQFQFAAGQPPKLAAVGAGMQRAIPDSSWGARALPDAIEVGQLDDTGTMAAPVKLALPGATQVIAVIGAWADGVVVYGAGTQLVVARCKSGACTPAKPLTVRAMAFATDAATGHTVIVFADDKTSAMWGITLDPAKLDAAPANLDTTGFPKLMCLTADDVWVQYTIEGDSRILRQKLDAVADIPNDDDHALMGCSPGGAVLFKSYEPSYLRCAQQDCATASPKSQRDKVPVAVTPTGLVGVEARGAVLAVRKGGPTDFYAVPNGLVPLVAMTDGNTLDVLAWTGDGLVITRVSAR